MIGEVLLAFGLVLLLLHLRKKRKWKQAASIWMLEEEIRENEILWMRAVMDKDFARAAELTDRGNSLVDRLFEAKGVRPKWE